jgi:protein SCO1/2
LYLEWKDFGLTDNIDPEGDFVEAIGRNFTADQAAKVISDHIKDWEKPLKKETRWE